MIGSRFGYLLRRKRKADRKHYSLHEVARQTGLAYTTVYYWYLGDIRSFHAETLYSLCKWLDCSIADILVIEN